MNIVGDVGFIMKCVHVTKLFNAVNGIEIIYVFFGAVEAAGAFVEGSDAL